ncbi:Aldehyde dehydrogenase [Fulvivirga imtechensis AK7]|uniref:Aldehyde dehydrogenase n=1 Tax=Fulvivirga imtechensis AK7 TaxID=1237149 RepID=L8JUX3_9BACT|nr:aldehyde dehydrogenase family protein [Fulvivirga imtechensis]ELR72786.1 Aldehyde dehydrogenase [Fulvivirga imtechensis AK7]
MSDPNHQKEASIDTYSEVFRKQRAKALTLRTERLNERTKRLKKLQLWIEKNQKAIQDAVYRDFKKPALEVNITEIYPVLTEIKHALLHLKNWAKPKKVDAPVSMLGTTSFIRYEPKGVCLIIAPWNFPFNLAVGPLVSALAAGNTVILKPSEMTRYTSELIDSMIGDIFTEDEVRVFNGGVDVSQALLQLPFDHIFFTGSPAVGKHVMRAAAENLTSVTLELGGKSPAIVDETANIKDTAEKIAWGKFINNGQTCVAPDYVLIHPLVKGAFIDQLKLASQRLFNHDGQGFQQSKDYARIINNNHFNRLDGLIKDAVEKGANIVMGGNLVSEDRFIPPTVLTDVAEDARILEEEIFGPVLPVVEYSSIEDVIQTVNNKPKPLALYYFGQSNKNKRAILNATSSGAVCINECVLHFNHPNLPFGGVNNSGMGKSHGWYGFLAFSNEKPVLRQRIGFTTTKTVYPPYNNRVKSIVKLLTKYF